MTPDRALDQSLLALKYNTLTIKPQHPQVNKVTYNRLNNNFRSSEIGLNALHD